MDLPHTAQRADPTGMVRAAVELGKHDGWTGTLPQRNLNTKKKQKLRYTHLNEDGMVSAWRADQHP